jgi:hypothetical protein
MPPSLSLPRPPSPPPQSLSFDAIDTFEKAIFDDVSVSQLPFLYLTSSNLMISVQFCANERIVEQK